MKGKGEESQTVNQVCRHQPPSGSPLGGENSLRPRFLAATLARCESDAICVLQELYVPLI